MEKRKKIYIAVAIFIFLVIIFGNNHFKRLIIYKKTKKKLEMKLKNLRKENQELEKKIGEFEKNPEKAYFEYARENLGMIKKSEKKYRFIK